MAEVARTISADTVAKRKSGQKKLIAGLAVALLLLNLPAKKDAAETQDAPTPESAAESQPADSTAARPPVREIAWPEVPLDFLLTNNPFRSASAVEQNQPSETDQSSAESQRGLLADSDGNSDDRRESRPVQDAATSVNLDSAQPFTAESELAGSKLQLIFRSARGRAVMIDGRVYNEGDQFGQYEVARIGPDRVTLRRDSLTAQPQP